MESVLVNIDVKMLSLGKHYLIHRKKSILDICINIVYLFCMEAKIQKWGNSLGIRIPNNIIKDLSLKNGSTVDINEEADHIIITPKKNLEDLLNCITKENLHTEKDFGIIEGIESW
jgi:antitoxin MazE